MRNGLQAASRRDTPIVAWHAVPGKACPERNRLRLGGYDRAYLIPEVFFGKCRRQRYKKMDMVFDAAKAFRDQSILLSDTAYVRPKAFSKIRIKDRNTFLCAENAMNIQAR